MNHRPAHRKALVNRRRAARRQAVRRRAQRTTGRAAGFSLIELLIVVAIIGIIAAIAIPNLLASRRAANEASAISSVRSLSTAEANYKFTTGVGFYGSLGQLESQNMIDMRLSRATDVAHAKNGYLFGLIVMNGGEGYVAGAAPVNAASGTRNFSSDEPGVIYANGGATIVWINYRGERSAPLLERVRELLAGA